MIQNQVDTSTQPVPNRYMSAAELGRDFLNDYHGEHRDKRGCELLEVIYRLAIDRCDGLETPDTSLLSFDPTDIVAGMDGRTANESDPTQNGKKVTNWWSKGKVQDDLRAGLEDQAQRVGLAYIPWIVKEAGGGKGRVSVYRLTTQDIEARTEQAHGASVPEGWIRYYRESARRPPFAPLINKPLGGLQSRLMLAVVLLLFAMTAVYSWLGILALLNANPAGAVRNITVALVAGAWIYLLSGHLYRSRDRGVVIAGLFTSPLNDDEPTQLVSERTQAGRQVLLVKHYSQCEVPGCGGRVTVRNGSGDQRSRLVGCCEHAPREHVYTFDHVTRLGHPLRTAAALSASYGGAE